LIVFKIAVGSGTHKLTCRLKIELIGLVKRKKFKFSDFAPRFAILSHVFCSHFICWCFPVFIFCLCPYLDYLIVQYTIEEKVIERAYKKLALDALVIQQGRLAEQKSKDF
jgi:hypothetical protein